jgi:hypothetical protein
MSGKALQLSKLSQQYDAGAIKKDFDKIQKALNLLSKEQGSLDTRIRNEVLGVRKLRKEMLEVANVAYWTEWFEDVATGEAVAKIIFSSGWNRVADVQYRFTQSSNVADSATWTGLADGGYISFVEQSASEADRYPQGGWYELRIAIPGYGRADKKDTFQAQIRALSDRGDVLAFAENTFDTDKLPDIVSAELYVGPFDGTNYPVYIKGQCDIDSLSIGIGARGTIGDVAALPTSGNPYTSVTFNTLSYDLFTDDEFTIGDDTFVSDGAYSAGSAVAVGVDSVSVSVNIAEASLAYGDWSIDDNIVPGDFATSTKNFTASDKRFDILLGSYPPSTPVYALARAYSLANKLGDVGNPPYTRKKIYTPNEAVPFDINTDIGAGDIAASMLEGAAQRATTRISVRRKTSDPDNTIQYTGEIEYADGTTYQMAGDGTTYQDLTPASTAYYFIFFDPSGDYGEGTTASPTQMLQITTDLAIAGDVTGRRIMVGAMSKAANPGERTFYVLPEAGQMTITAAYMYALSLSAITARLGKLTIGWLESGGGMELGPDITYRSLGTLAALSASGNPITSVTFATLSYSLSSGDKFRVGENIFEANAPATAGSSVAVSVVSVEIDGDIAGATAVTQTLGGIYLDQYNYWYDDGTFRVGDATKYVSWDGANMNVTGSITLEYDDLVDTAGTKPADNATVGATWGTDLASIPATLSVPSGAGLYLSSTHLGYYDGGAWDVYIKNDATFLFSKDANNYISFDGATFKISVGDSSIVFDEDGISTVWYSSDMSAGTVFSAWYHSDGGATSLVREQFVISGVASLHRYAEDRMRGVWYIRAASPIVCKVDGAQSGTLTQLAVKELTTTFEYPGSVYLSDGTELAMTALASAGDTTIYFSSASITASDNAEIYANYESAPDEAGFDLFPSGFGAPGSQIWGYKYPRIRPQGMMDVTDMLSGMGTNCLFSQTATVTIAGTVAGPTTLRGSGEGTYTIPAYTMGAGTVIRYRASGYYQTDGSTISPRLVVGGTIYAGMGLQLATTSASDKGWYSEGEITIRTGGASGTCICQAVHFFETGSPATHPVMFVARANTATQTINTNTTNDMDFQLAWSTGDAGDSISCTNLTFEILRPVHQ